MKRTWILAGAPALALVTACSGGSHFSSASPPRVPVSLASHLTQAVRVGVIVTGAVDPGQGHEDLGLAAGARVAEYRLGLASPGKVSLDVVDDHGNSAGSVAAVRQLVHDQVAGIVYASEGSHIADGVKAATAAGVAVILPYDTQQAGAGNGVWTTGPTQTSAVQRIGNFLRDRHIQRPMVVIARGAAPALNTLSKSQQTVVVDDSGALPASTLTTLSGAKAPDGVVVWAPSQTEANVVTSLQRSHIAVPIVLGPGALSSDFAGQLAVNRANGDATTAGEYLTVGVPATDANPSSGTSAFLAALRLASKDPAVLGLNTAESFSAAGAATADVRSHDAVLAIVAGAVKANSVNAANVRSALGDLKLTQADGIAGPALDFTNAVALDPDRSVVTLAATTQDQGQREGIDQAMPGIEWFALAN
jgi:branched-chain amino acid transport system substrate-binding protein